jgi:SNF2 family DNA or RNA helicase
MVKMIDFIDEFCEFRKYPCERLDGRIAGNERQKSIDRCVRQYVCFVVLSVCMCAHNLLESKHGIISSQAFVH